MQHKEYSLNFLKICLDKGGKHRYAISLFIGKGAFQTLRFFKRGGTALPGLLVEKIYDNFLGYVSQYIKNSIFISGTNGKTTTARLIVNMLKKGNMKVINNLAGSNLKRGIISAIIPYLTLRGFKSDVDYAVFECDEFALDTIVKDIQPKVLILNNLFRDQLDRYGERKSYKQ